MKTPPPYPPPGASLTALAPSRNVLGPAGRPTLPPLPQADVEAAEGFFRAAKADNTRKAYESDWASWSAWCAASGQVALPASPEAVAVYLAGLARQGRKYATLTRRLSTIRRVHVLKGHPLPESQAVNMVLAGVARKRGRQSTQKEPVTRDDLAAMLRHLPPTKTGARDRLVLLLGWAGAFRGSELVALAVEDLEWFAQAGDRPAGVVCLVRRSKTDQEGEGLLKPIQETGGPLCAVAALRTWLQASGITKGPVLRGLTRGGHGLRATPLTLKAVSGIVKHYAKLAGLDPERVASHSLRAGHVTQGYSDGVDEASLMAMTGHSRSEMLRRYDRRRMKNPFAGVSSALLGGAKT